MGATKKYKNDLLDDIKFLQMDIYEHAIRYIKIRSLTKKHPNDTELGKAVREYLKEQDLLNKK